MPEGMSLAIMSQRETWIEFDGLIKTGDCALVFTTNDTNSTQTDMREGVVFIERYSG